MKNIFRFASLLIGAVVLFACEIDPINQGGTLEEGMLQLKSDVSLIKSNGLDTVRFSVAYDTLDITSDVEILYKEEMSNEEAVVLENNAFMTTKEGLYKFWVEYEGLSDTLSVMATADGKAWEIQMAVDRDVIQSNGQDVATLKVVLGGKYDVTSESAIYDENDKELSLEDGKFMTSTAGEYNFWAQYGTSSTYNKKLDNSGMLTVKAIPFAIPEVAADPQAENTSFVHRAFLTQYTGTGCGYCPYMIRIIKQIMAEKTIPEKAVLAAVHSYTNADPAYIPAPRVGSYPYLTVDLVQGFSHSQSASVLTKLVDESIASDAKAGISANPIVYAQDGCIIVRVAVKAATDGIFNVGAWLLEDEIYAMQSDYDGIKKSDPENDYDTHECCVRVADSKYKGGYFGYPLGEMKVGETAYKTFVLDIKKSWKLENMHLALFASYSTDGNKYTVCNAVDVPLTDRKSVV